MGSLVRGARRPRPTSFFVFLTLVAIVVTLAVGSRLAGQPGPVQPLEERWASSNEQPMVEAAKVEALVRHPAAAPQATPQAAPAPGTLAEDEGGSWLVAQADDAAGPRVDDALIVRTATLELEVADVPAALAEARSAISEVGGYISGSDAYDQGETRWATVTYRVPVDRFIEAIDTLRGAADRVVRETTQSMEVTGQVVDLDARIANLRASEAALVDIMDRAGRIDDVLAVQMRLQDVRGQIEQLEAQRAHLADQAALSTLTVSWYTPVAAVAVAQEGWDIASEVDAAMAQTLAALQGLVSLAVWFVVVVLPLLGLPLLAVVLTLVLVRRRLTRPQPTGPAAAD